MLFIHLVSLSRGRIVYRSCVSSSLCCAGIVVPTMTHAYYSRVAIYIFYSLWSSLEVCAHIVDMFWVFYLRLAQCFNFLKSHQKVISLHIWSSSLIDKTPNMMTNDETIRWLPVYQTDKIAINHSNIWAAITFYRAFQLKPFWTQIFKNQLSF